MGNKKINKEELLAALENPNYFDENSNKDTAYPINETKLANDKSQDVKDLEKIFDESDNSPESKQNNSNIEDDFEIEEEHTSYNTKNNILEDVFDTAEDTEEDIEDNNEYTQQFVSDTSDTINDMSSSKTKADEKISINPTISKDVSLDALLAYEKAAENNKKEDLLNEERAMGSVPVYHNVSSVQPVPQIQPIYQAPYTSQPISVVQVPVAQIPVSQPVIYPNQAYPYQTVTPEPNNNNNNVNGYRPPEPTASTETKLNNIVHNTDIDTVKMPSIRRKKRLSDTLVGRLFTKLLPYVILTGLLYCIFSYIIIPERISGDSMNPTYYNKDIVLMDGISYMFNAPERFDVVGIKDANGKDIIKRIIGLPGETVQIKDGKIYITDIEGNETELDGKDYIKNKNYEAGVAEKPVKLKKDEYFVIGDNKKNSLDSRSALIGNINKKQIMGKIIFKVYPFK